MKYKISMICLLFTSYIVSKEMPPLIQYFQSIENDLGNIKQQMIVSKKANLELFDKLADQLLESQSKTLVISKFSKTDLYQALQDKTYLTPPLKNLMTSIHNNYSKFIPEISIPANKNLPNISFEQVRLFFISIFLETQIIPDLPPVAKPKTLPTISEDKTTLQKLLGYVRTYFTK